jgi:hypothetical protein
MRVSFIFHSSCSLKWSLDPAWQTPVTAADMQMSTCSWSQRGTCLDSGGGGGLAPMRCIDGLAQWHINCRNYLPSPETEYWSARWQSAVGFAFFADTSSLLGILYGVKRNALCGVNVRPYITQHQPLSRLSEFREIRYGNCLKSATEQPWVFVKVGAVKVRPTLYLRAWVKFLPCSFATLFVRFERRYCRCLQKCVLWFRVT